VRLALTPWLNHGWQVPLYVTARGLGTSAIHLGNGEAFEIDLDFVDHRLAIRSSRAAERGFALAPMSVAEFHRRLFAELAAVGVDVAIHGAPNEVEDATPFVVDTAHASYDAAAVGAFFGALAHADRVLRRFRTSFLGKASPVHFFWGSFDLAVTRFSGRPAPLHPGGVPGLPDAVTREAYSHEVSSAGFWPGSDAFPQPAFYSYAYPEPEGFRDRPVTPGARFDETLGEFILPYDTVRSAAKPDALLLDFLSTTYAAAAEAGGWDRDPWISIPLAWPRMLQRRMHDWMYFAEPEATMDGYALRGEPPLRNTNSRAACTSYSCCPGRAKRMASMWASRLISQARRWRASSSGARRSRISWRSGPGSSIRLGVMKPRTRTPRISATRRMTRGATRPSSASTTSSR